MTNEPTVAIQHVKTKMEGRIKITDKTTGEILVEKNNAINFINMSEAIASSLANRSSGHIRTMVFGNGASTVSGIGAITYYPPNTNTPDAQLYRQTYEKIVDATDPQSEDRDINNIVVQKIGASSTYADIVVTCTLGHNEPNDQQASDTITDTENDYVFDELGLKSSGGKLLTHVVFYPILKSANRIIEIEYTLRTYLV